MGEAPIWGRFWELGDLSPDERGLVRRARHEVRRALLAHPRIASNYSLSHADLHPENIRATIMKALFAELGVIPKQWCWADEISSLGLDVEPLEVAVADTESMDKGIVPAFQHFCGACHRTQSAFPPNFLSGPEPEIMANLSHCAELTNFRLNLWRLPAAKRPKSPMPPALAVRAKGHDLDQWPHSDMLLALTEQAAARDRSTNLEALLEREYATLGKCL